ncbi:MAG: flagellar motor protein MotB [Candidatus Latescibacterota bacterium]|nr:flagellar motor protein MotB [Candidatus Latescibacterota bacterium]
MAKKEKCPDCPEMPAWLTTFGDLMALLLTFFVLLLSFSTTSQNDFEKAVGALQGALGVLDGEPIMTSPIKLHVPIVKGDINEARPTLKDAKAEIEKEMEASGQNENVEVIEGPDGIVIRIKEGVLFPTGTADIRDEFKSTLSRIGSVLNQMENEVVIEGHTDNVPIQTDDFENNHWLSAGRAGQVLDYFVNEVGIEQTRLGMAGYGDNKPLGSNDTFEGRAQNRRVEIRVLYGDGPEEATPDSVKGLIEAASLQVQSDAAAQQEP